METVTIPIEEYRNLILENRELRNEVEFLKNRVDRGICDIMMEIHAIKDKIE